MRVLDVRNPRTGELDYEIPAFSEPELADIASCLRTAQPDWVSLSLSERGARLDRLASEISARAIAICGALEADTGRRRMSRTEIDAVIGTIAGRVAEASAMAEEDWVEGLSNLNIRHRPQYVPYQLVGVISPWNFPLLLSLIDAIPALLAGCTVLVKPSEVTPRFVAPLVEAVEAAGMNDVLAFVTGDGPTGAALIDQVDAVCFTGSVATGRLVARQAAERLIPAFLELGGKDPLVILKGADLEAASDAALRGSVAGTGQACQSIERIYVDADIHDDFVQLLIRKAAAVRLNAERIDAGDIGPVIFERQARILEEQIADAVAKGATVQYGGKVENTGGGLWLRPTVLTGVTHEMKVMQEETFGPIMPVMAFRSEEEAIALANDTQFGLSGAVMGADLETALRVGEQIDAGAISLNDASLTSLFHEAEKHSFKASGLGGSRMGRSGIMRFFRRKALIANTGKPVCLSAFSEDS